MHTKQPTAALDPVTLLPAADETATHPWERAGLGKAPFRFVGTESYAANAPGGMRFAGRTPEGFDFYTSPGTSCDYCGMAIMEAYRIKSADGRRFKVGCDCVAKANDSRSRVAVEVDSARRKLARDKRKARGGIARAETIAALAKLDTRRALRSKPHPRIASLTLLDYAVWMLRHSGTAGTVKVAKIVRAEVL